MQQTTSFALGRKGAAASVCLLIESETPTAAPRYPVAPPKETSTRPDLPVVVASAKIPLNAAAAGPHTNNNRAHPSHAHGSMSEATGAAQRRDYV